MPCECCEKGDAVHTGWYGIRICDKCYTSNIGYVSIVIRKLREKDKGYVVQTK